MIFGILNVWFLDIVISILGNLCLNCKGLFLMCFVVICGVILI